MTWWQGLDLISILTNVSSTYIFLKTFCVVLHVFMPFLFYFCLQIFKAKLFLYVLLVFSYSNSDFTIKKVFSDNIASFVIFIEFFHLCNWRGTSDQSYSGNTQILQKRNVTTDFKNSILKNWSKLIGFLFVNIICTIVKY